MPPQSTEKSAAPSTPTTRITRHHPLASTIQDGTRNYDATDRAPRGIGRRSSAQSQTPSQIASVVANNVGGQGSSTAAGARGHGNFSPTGESDASSESDDEDTMPARDKEVEEEEEEEEEEENDDEENVNPPQPSQRGSNSVRLDPVRSSPWRNSQIRGSQSPTHQPFSSQIPNAQLPRISPRLSPRPPSYGSRPRSQMGLGSVRHAPPPIQQTSGSQVPDAQSPRGQSPHAPPQPIGGPTRSPSVYPSRHSSRSSNPQPCSFHSAPSTIGSPQQAHTPQSAPNPELIPSPEPDVSAETTSADQPVPNRSFWSVFIEQVTAEKERFYTFDMGVAALLASILLKLQVCSLGNICEQQPFAYVLFIAFRHHPSDYICLSIANVLVFAGVWDIFTGIGSVVVGIGKRRAHENQEDEDKDEQDRNLLQRIYQHARAAKPFGEDVYDKVMEPVLRLTLTVAYRWMFDFEGSASSVQLVMVSVMLYLVKWLSQTITILYAAQHPWLQPQRRLFVSVMILFATPLLYKQILLMLHGNPDKRQAEWFNNARTSEGQVVGRVRIEHLPAENPRPAGAAIHRVTNTIVTNWVTQAMRR